MSAQKKQLLSKLRGQTILVIDPQNESLYNLKEIFECSVKLIHSQEINDSISVIQDKNPNIVFINCDSAEGAQIPFDGYEISQDIKQLEAYTLIPTIPVILYTKDSSNLNNEKFSMSAADSFMVAPFNEQNLIDNLSKLQMYKYIVEQ